MAKRGRGIQKQSEAEKEYGKGERENAPPKRRHKAEQWKDGYAGKLKRLRAQAGPGGGVVQGRKKFKAKASRHQQLMCGGKISHERIEDAEAHMDMLVFMGDKSGTLNAYPCDYCGKFHVGHRRKNWINYNTQEVGGDGGKRRKRKRERRIAGSKQGGPSASEADFGGEDAGGEEE